jgi:hypothetical protein
MSACTPQVKSSHQKRQTILKYSINISQIPHFSNMGNQFPEIIADLFFRSRSTQILEIQWHESGLGLLTLLGIY